MKENVEMKMKKSAKEISAWKNGELAVVIESEYHNVIKRRNVKIIPVMKATVI